MSNLATIVNNILADSGIDDINVVVTTGSYTNPAWIVSLPWTKITGTPTTLAGYGITDAYTQTQVNTLLNAKQNTLTLTTTGTSGAATLVGATLNIPQYQSVLTNPVTGAGTQNYLSKWSITGSSLTNSQIFDNGTNVAIGTNDFGADGLSLTNGSNLSFSEGAGTSYANIFRQRNSAATIIAHSLKRSSTSTFASSIGVSVAKAAIAVGYNAGSISFFSDAPSVVANGTDFAPTERMTIINNGNIGVNNPTPTAQLHIRSGGSYTNTDANNRIIVERDAHTYLLFVSPTEFDQGIHFAIPTGITGRLAYHQRAAGDFMSFTVASAIRMQLFHTGNLYVGSSPTDAGYRLDVNGTGRFQDSLTVNNYLYVQPNVASGLQGLYIQNNNTGGYGASLGLGLYGYTTGAYFNTLRIESSYPAFGRTLFYTKAQSNSTEVLALNLDGTGAAAFGSTLSATTLTANTGLITSVGTNAFVDINGSTAGTLAAIRLQSDGSTKWIISHSTPSTYRFSIGRATSATGFTEYLGIDYTAGATTLSNLAGTGTRMVVADASGALSTQAIGSGAITGSGTTNYVPKFTSASAVGNSLMYDNGTSIVIGGTGVSASEKFRVSGSISSSGLVRFENGVNQADVNHGTLMIVNTASYAIGNDASIGFALSSDVGGIDPRASIGAKTESAYGAALVFNTRSDAGTYTEKVRITGIGRVGIANATPFSLLHVGTRPGAGNTNPSLGSIATISNDGLTGIDLGANVNANTVVGHINWVNGIGVANHNTARIDVYATGGTNSGSLRFWTASAASSPTIRLTIASTGDATFTSSVTAGGTSGGNTATDSLRILNTDAGGGNLVVQNVYSVIGKIGVSSEDVGSGTFNDGVFKVQLAADGALQDRLTINSRGLASFSGRITQTSDFAQITLNRTGGTTFGAGIQYQTSGTNNWIVGTAQATVGTDYSIYNYATSTGALNITYGTNNVQIGGTTDAGFKLDVIGTGRFTGSLTSSGLFSNNISSLTYEASSAGAIQPGVSEFISTGFNVAGGTSQDISTISLPSNTQWKAIITGGFANNFEGGGLTSPNFSRDIDGTNSTISVGSTTLTFSRNSSTGKLQVSCSNAPYRATFVGTIHLVTFPQSSIPSNTRAFFGRVGINTAAPGTALEILSRAADADRTIPHNVLTITALQGNAPYGFFGGSILFKNSSYVTGVVESARIRSVIYDDGAPNNFGGGIWFETTPTPGGALTPSVVINYQGRVGVGTTTPSTLFHVYSTTNADTVGHIQYENGNSGTGSACNAQLIGKSRYGTTQLMVWENYGIRFGMRSTANGGAGSIFFTTGTDSVGMVLTSSNRLLVGGITTDSGYTLDVSGNSRITGQFLQGSGGARSTNGTTIALTNNTTFSANSDIGDGARFLSIVNESTTVSAFSNICFRINPASGGSSGNVMLDMKFVNNGSVTSTLYWTFLHGGSWSDRMSLTSAGALTAVSFFESSDSRLKTLIKDDYRVLGIESVKAKLYLKEGKEEIGYYAQDLESILPSAVSKNDAGFLSLSYTQVHTAKIAIIEDEIDVLKRRVSELEKQLKNK